MKNKINLSTEEIEELEDRVRTIKDKKNYIKLRAIKLKNQGMVNSKIANELGVSGETIRVWVKLFLTQGFDGLCMPRPKTRRAVLDPYHAEIADYLNKNLISNIAQIKDFLKERHIPVVSRWAISRFLKDKLNYSFKKLD